MPAALLLLAFVSGRSSAQTTGNLWFRYILQVPLHPHWTLRFEPDLRVEMAPDPGRFQQLLFRTEVQRHLGEAHAVAAGALFLDAGLTRTDQLQVQEWRPHVAWSFRPALPHRPLLLRLRGEYRSISADPPGETGTTLVRAARVRSLLQDDLAFRRDEEGHLLTGLRLAIEGLWRAWGDAVEPGFDQFRAFGGVVQRVSHDLDLEIGYMWLLREHDVQQHWLRMTFAHHVPTHHAG
ncbi:MAG: DUF2490 domain-containing protein [Flavobacteriales bacterium]|nr:DUF2490 domain-containing protein [Flavobacteriales bacterium]